MSANVSVGYTPQTTDIFVCRRHVGNVVPTRRQHSVMSANFSAVGIMSVRPVADTHSYMYVGISTDEVVTTYEDKKNWHPLRFSNLSQVLTLSKSKKVQEVETGNVFSLVMWPVCCWTGGECNNQPSTGAAKVFDAR